MNRILISIVFLVFMGSTVNSQTTYNYYYGNIHSQSSYSDGNKDSATSLMTTPLQDFNYARASQHIDFYGISDHNHLSAGMKNPLYYHRGIADATTANVDGSFVALYGMEWGVISGGGHVIIYGSNNLIGWDAGDYDVFNAQTDYPGLFTKVAAIPGAFAYFAHPQSTDYGNFFSSPYNVTADSAVVGMTSKSGPAFSTNNTYSNPSTSSFVARYQDALKLGYHVGIGLDHDTHNSVYGRQSAGRLVVLAPSLTRANILAAFKKRRFYSSDDWNARVDLNISAQPMGSIMTRVGSPTINISITDPDIEAVSSIQLFYGVPGSGVAPTLLTSNTSLSTLTYTHAIANLSTYYYYAQITQVDGDVIYTSPIWYTRNDAASMVPVAGFALSSNSVCPGQSVTFTDQSTNSPTTWAWTFPGGTPASSALQNPVVTYSTPGTYTVTLVASNSSGSNSTQRTLTVNPNPVVTAAAGNASVCAGTSTTLTAGGASTYSWSPATTLSASTGAAVTATPSSTITYTVTGTSVSGCSSSNTVTVTVRPLPVIASTSSNPTYCSGGSSTLTASGASTYSWTPGTALSATTGASVVASPTSTTTYTITGTAVNGCTNSSTVTVTVNPNPVANAGSNTAICIGSSTQLTASGGTSYSWSPGAGLSSTIIANPVATPTATTAYTVTVSNGCTSTSTVTITVNPLPPAPTVTQTGSVLTSSAATSYQWYLNSVIIAGATQQSYTYTQAGSYKVCITNVNGCKSCSAIISTVMTGVENNLSENSINVFPNPNNGSFDLQFNMSNTGNYDLSISNALGQIVFSEAINLQGGNTGKHIDLSGFGSGVYLVTLYNEKNQLVRKVIVF